MSTEHAPTPRLRSRQGVDALIAQACAQHEAQLLAQTFSPLFPEDSPWSRLASIPEEHARQFKAQLAKVAAATVQYRVALTATAGQLAGVLDASEEEVRAMALNFARLDLSGMPDLSAADRGKLEQLPAVPEQEQFPGLFMFLAQPGLPASPQLRKLLWTEHLLGAPVPGKSTDAKLSRICDARFWRRAIRARLIREREH